jgi:hypothetical protein
MIDPAKLGTSLLDINQTRITRFAAGLGAGGTVATFALGGPRDALGFLIGAVLSLITVRSWFKLAGAVGASGELPGTASVIFLVLRYVLIAGAVYAIINVLRSSPVALILGLLVSFAAVLLEVLFGLKASA